MLKLSAPAVATPLTTLFNYCIRTSILSNDWRMSNMTDKNKDRPDSVLSAIFKLLERVIFDQLYASFVPNMSGFLK